MTEPTQHAESVRWCVKHREGWCAVKHDHEPAEGSLNVPTGCGYYVTFPWGYDQRAPDCPECLKDGVR